MITWYKAKNPKAQFIFAHGAGAGMESDFMQQLTSYMQELGVSVGLFDFEYMQQAKLLGKKRPPQRANKLIPYYSEVVSNALPNLPLFVGGKSMGGRMATLLACDEKFKGCIAFGYPFHPVGKPDKLRTEHLSDLTCPLFIIQGERDTFGNKTEVLSYNLCDNTQLCWIEDGDHSLVPRKSANVDKQTNWQTAAQRAVQFIESQL